MNGRNMQRGNPRKIRTQNIREDLIANKRSLCLADAIALHGDTDPF